MSSDFDFTLGNVCAKPYFNTQWEGPRAGTAGEGGK